MVLRYSESMESILAVLKERLSRTIFAAVKLKLTLKWDSHCTAA